VNRVPGSVVSSSISTNSARNFASTADSSPDASAKATKHRRPFRFPPDAKTVPAERGETRRPVSRSPSRARVSSSFTLYWERPTLRANSTLDIRLRRAECRTTRYRAPAGEWHRPESECPVESCAQASAKRELAAALSAGVRCQCQALDDADELNLVGSSNRAHESVRVLSNRLSFPASTFFHCSYMPPITGRSGGPGPVNFRHGHDGRDFGKCTVLQTTAAKQLT